MLLVLAVVTPVRLHQDGVDLFGIHHADLISHRFDHAYDAEIFDASQHALAAAANEVHRCFANSKALIITRETLPTSMMPPGLMAGFTVHEMASLLDYLESLGKKKVSP